MSGPAAALPALALSTANLYSAVPQAGNPVDTGVTYGGNPANY